MRPIREAHGATNAMAKTKLTQKRAPRRGSENANPYWDRVDYNCGWSRDWPIDEVLHRSVRAHQEGDRHTVDAMGLILDALGCGDFGAAVERQEARGQRDLVASETLPTRLGVFRENAERDRRTLCLAGVKFLGPTDDPLFQRVELPAGWTKRKTDHHMWSELVDADGDVVASIFYKAASYDRDAFLGGLKGEWIAKQTRGGAQQ